MRAQLDFNSYFGPGLSKVTAKSGGNGLKSRFFLRRLNFEAAGEFMKRFQFYAGLEIVQTVGNANGTAELSAASAGETPSCITKQVTRPTRSTTRSIRNGEAPLTGRA